MVAAGLKNALGGRPRRPQGASPRAGMRSAYFSMTYLPSLVTLTIGAWSAS
jgi:hypothetical protein